MPTVNMAALNGLNAADASLSRSLDLSQPDRVRQRVLDSILWHAMRGPHARVPPPGPNAVAPDTAGG